MIVVLGLLSTFGPLSLDLYLPALPQLAEQLHASTSAAQLSITACLLGLATGQLVAGPLSDRLGRRRPLIVGLAAYLLVSAACAFAPSVSLLVLPTRAHGLLAESAATVILALRDLLDLLLQDPTRSPDGTALAARQLSLNQALARVEGFVDEVRRERANRLADAPDAEPVARNLRRLRHDLTAIGRSVTEPLPEPARQYLTEATSQLRWTISDHLAGCAAAVRGRRAPPSLDQVDQALMAFREAMDRLRQSGRLRGLGIEEVERAFSLAFAVQQLRADLGDLAGRIAEHATLANP